MKILPDEPSVRSCLATGYPGRIKACYCRRCGNAMYGSAFYVAAEWICTECFQEWVHERYYVCPEELADCLGVDILYLS